MRVTAFVLAGLSLAGCSVVPLADTRPSAEQVATAVLAALERRDRAGLEALALTPREFEQHVWHDLPAARPERNLPWEYVWGELHQKSAQSLNQVLAQHGGRRLALVSLRFAGASTQYARHRVHRATILTVRSASGATEQLRLFGAMLEQSGHWKVFSYVTDD